jgi:hypothetical protein
MRPLVISGPGHPFFKPRKKEEAATYDTTKKKVIYVSNNAETQFSNNMHIVTTLIL